MSTGDRASRKIRQVAGALVLGSLAIAALCAFAAVTTGPGGSRPMFTLVAAAFVVTGVAAAIAFAVARSGGRGRWSFLVVALMVVAFALTVAATTQEDAPLMLPLLLAPFLPFEWWLAQALRRTHAPAEVSGAA